MPSNNKLEDIVQVALPYVQPAYKLEPQSDEPPVYYQASSSSQELADEEEEEPVLRVTTRSRLTYELDRYNKKELLIIKTGGADQPLLYYILTAFRLLNFGITAIEADEINEDEFWHKIDQFFQKDFSNTGAVAVITITPPQQNRASTTSHRFQEFDVLNYFRNHQPPTLDGRPKIFISEASEPSSPPEITSLPVDTLLIQTKKDMPAIPQQETRPLTRLCCDLSLMDDNCKLLDLISKLNESYQGDSMNEVPVTYLSTMTKELLFENEENAKDLYFHEGMAEILKDPNLRQIYAPSMKATDTIIYPKRQYIRYIDLNF